MYRRFAVALERSLDHVILIPCTYRYCLQDEAELAKRVAALEVGAKFEAIQNDVKEMEKEFLAKLQEIRETMVKDGTGGGGTTSSKDQQALVEENNALKKRNAKLEYRVQHILKSMEELYAKSKQ